MEQRELRSAIEAILVASPDPVSSAELAAALEIAQGEVEEQLQAIGEELEKWVGGFMLERVAGGVRFATRPELDEHLRRFFSKRREHRMSMAALETLAIVAYRQPITGPEVSELRGVNSSGVLRTLLERRMIRIAGRKNVVGSPFLYRTTKDFLLHFGLDRIQDLPKLEEFGEILGEQVTDDLGLAELVEEVAETARENETDSGETAAILEELEADEQDHGSSGEPTLERKEDGHTEPEEERLFSGEPDRSPASVGTTGED